MDKYRVRLNTYSGGQYLYLKDINLRSKSLYWSANECDAKIFDSLTSVYNMEEKVTKILNNALNAIGGNCYRQCIIETISSEI